MGKKLKKFWKSLGPGLITGVSDDDPGGLTMYTIAGSRFGYAMLWVLLFILPLMIAVQEMCARIGALSGCGLAGNIKRHYPAWLLAIVAGLIVLANTFNVGANIYGMAGAVNLLVPLPLELIAVLLSAGITFLVIKLKYRQIVSIFKWLSLTLFAYIIAFFTVSADWGAILRHTLIPTIQFDKEFLTVLFAVAGTTISPYLYFWQASEEAEEFKQNNPRIRVCKFRDVTSRKLNRLEFDTRIGMSFSNIIAFFVIALAATTLFRAGAGGIETLAQAAQALEPIAGPYASLLFMTGIIGVGLLSIPVLAGSAAYVVAEVFDWDASLDKPFTRAREFYVTIALSVAIGLAIPFIGITPVEALFYTGILNGIIAPILILLIMHMSTNPAIVGPHQTTRTIHALGHISFFLMTAGAIFVILVH